MDQIFEFRANPKNAKGISVREWVGVDLLEVINGRVNEARSSHGLEPFTK